MNTYKAKGARTGITFGLIILCAIALICTGIFSPIGVGNDGIKITQTASGAVNPTYGSFFHGSTYRYTDSTKVETAHNGSISDDTTLVTVDSSYAHGTQKNPYVIDSIARWNAFVADMANTTSGITDHGKGKFFVLACDLDFNGINFTPVSRFDGSFYGLGHTFNNVSINGIENPGIFSNTYDAIIVDLSCDNFYFFNCLAMHGAIVAVAYGGYVLNCHTEGDFFCDSAAVVNGSRIVAGIIGDIETPPGSTSKLTTVYRCSSEFTDRKSVV